MAKNVIQTKKRVSHFQKTHKELDGENELFGYKDFVSSIIQDMDSNFNYIQSGYSKNGTKCNEQCFTTPEDFSSIPLLKIPSPSSSNGTLPIPAKHKKSRSFSLSKKFPLMEKSQKILKQLKHNQNIPKPRAHLATFRKSPLKSKPKYISPKISVAKKKEMVNLKNKASSIHSKFNSDSSFSNVTNSNSTNSHCSVTSNHSSFLNVKNSNLSKISKNDLPVKCSKLRENEDDTSGKSSLSDVLANIDSNEEKNSINESDSSTSDGEYERFVKKSKKGLKKKSSKRQKKHTKSKTCSKRKKLVHVSEQKSRLDDDYVTESSRNSDISLNKISKIIQADESFKTDSDCSEHDDIPDMPTRDSSSESDDGLASPLTLNARELKPANENIVSLTNSSQDCQNLNQSESNIDSNFVCSNVETQILNPVQLQVKPIGETEISAVSNMHQSSQNLCVVESNINSDKGQKENFIYSIKIEPGSLPSNMVIDLSDSEDESGSNAHDAPEFSSSKNALSTSIEISIKGLAESNSEESDLEIIEEVRKPVQTVEKCSASVSTNTSVCLKNVVGKKPDVQNLCVDVKSSVKTEDLDDKSLVHVLPAVKSLKEAENDKHDIVYTTDICHTKMMMEQTTIISSYSSKSQNVPSNRSLQANSDLPFVKNEIDSDDDIVILDSVHSTKVADASNLPSVKMEKVKSEQPATESKLKLLDTTDSEPMSDIAKEWENEFQDVVSLNSSELLEWLKMEYATYMEMKQANADVEASLKNLQARQAQKMLYVRSLLHKCVKSNLDTKQMTGSAPLSLDTLRSIDSKDFTSGNVQKDCDIAAGNSFSHNSQVILPSSTVQDTKPNVNMLQEKMHSMEPKTESNQGHLNRKIIPKIESDEKKTLKLLEKKCSVCGKDAVAACQRCAKVFFCSPECGRKFWIEGHDKVCGTR